MNKHSCTFSVENEILAVDILTKSTSVVQPNFVFLHGAGMGVKERIYGLAAPIVNGGYADLLAFDFSGHGKSTGELRQSSLKKKVIDLLFKTSERVLKTQK